MWDPSTIVHEIWFLLIAVNYSVVFSHSVVSDSLQPHGLQHARLPCPSPTPEACSNACPSSRWCHPTISSSVVPFVLIHHNLLGLPWWVQTVKNLPAVRETQVWALGWEEPLEKEMATHSSILAWRIPWTKRSLVGYSPRACKESDTTKWLTHTHHNLLICSIVDGLSDSSQCLAVINHAAMTVLVPGFWEIHVYIYV